MRVQANESRGTIFSRAQESILHQIISEFAWQFLPRSTGDRLAERFKTCESFCKGLRHRSSKYIQAVAPMDFKGHTVIGFLVQSLPYHLSQM